MEEKALQAASLTNLDKDDLAYYQGYHDCMKLVRTIFNYIENTYLSNISQTRKLENMYSVAKENLGTMMGMERGMFNHFKERFADAFEFNETTQRFEIKNRPDKEVSS